MWRQGDVLITCHPGECPGGQEDVPDEAPAQSGVGREVGEHLGEGVGEEGVEEVDGPAVLGVGLPAGGRG